MSAPAVTRAQVNAFRLGAQHLARRLPSAEFYRAFSAGPFQNTPPGAAGLSLLARVTDFAPGELDHLLVEQKTLLQTWSLRAAPHVFLTGEAAVYTLGLLPQGEAELEAFIQGIRPALAISGMTVEQVVAWTVAAIRDVLDGQVIDGKQNLDQALAAWIAPRLTDSNQAAAWNQSSLYAADQTLGEAMVSFTLRPAALMGWICLSAPAAAFTRADRWLGIPPPSDPDPSTVLANAAALLRRYLGSLSPSTPEHFAAWAGIGMLQARRVWEAVASDLREVRLNGRPAWVLERDLPRLEAQGVDVSGALEARDARFLPPHDPYLQIRDRSTLIQEQDVQRTLWRVASRPGLLLLDGRPAGLWRARKLPGRSGSERLLVTVEPLAELNIADRALIETEAQQLAPFKNCAGAAVEYNNGPL